MFSLSNDLPLFYVIAGKAGPFMYLQGELESIAF